MIAVSVFLTACDAFEDNLAFVCQGKTEVSRVENDEVVMSETTNARKFLSIKNRKIGTNECLTWAKDKIICQSAEKSLSMSTDVPVYTLMINREAGTVNESTETASGHTIFKGDCIPYKGPRL
jgi:hypothetical protein